MKKRIQLSTVRQEADVEVIYVNAALICKVINAHNAIDAIIDKALVSHNIMPLVEPKSDKDGNYIKDEDGKIVEKPVLDEKGNQVIDYDCMTLTNDQLRELYQTVLPFLTELRNVLEGE